MIKHSKSMVWGLAALGLALVASPVLAANTFTINETSTTGVAGTNNFIPTFISMADPNGIGGTATNGGIYIPYVGTRTTCTSFIGSNNGDCSGWASVAIQAWANGLYYDPRFGTPFIPPSGDHHRTGYRMLMQPSFSGGQWLSGFSPLNQRFPFFPEVGDVGPGGDIGLAMADASYQTGLDQIMGLVDAHGDPITTGKFPRYWSHERAAWVDNLMVKYTAGGGVPLVDEDAFAQSLRSSAGYSRNLDVRWRAMSNIDGAFSETIAEFGGPNSSCGGPWCEFYIIDGGTAGDFVDLHLYVAKSADGNTNTWDGSISEITEVTKLDTMGALTAGGVVLKTFALSDLEKLPFVVDDRLAQFSTETGDAADGTEAGGFGQQLAYQFRVYSGPNVHSEEGADPYSWVICGTRGHEYGEDHCEDPAGGGAIDAQLAGDSNGVTMAIVYNSNFQGQLGDSVLRRFGRDLNPARSNAIGNPVTVLDATGDPDQVTGVYVACTSLVAPGTPVTVSGIVYSASLCNSSAGLDGMYGTFDDGTIYYREAIENGLRGWIRENNAHAFSFLGADEDGLGGNTANFGLTQLVQQVDIAMGALVSCLNCTPHDLPLGQESYSYNFNWPGLPNITAIAHPPSGTVGAVVNPNGSTSVLLPVVPLP